MGHVLYGIMMGRQHFEKLQKWGNSAITVKQRVIHGDMPLTMDLHFEEITDLELVKLMYRAYETYQEKRFWHWSWWMSWKF